MHVCASQLARVASRSDFSRVEAVGALWMRSSKLRWSGTNLDLPRPCNPNGGGRSVEEISSTSSPRAPSAPSSPRRSATIFPFMPDKINRYTFPADSPLDPSAAFFRCSRRAYAHTSTCEPNFISDANMMRSCAPISISALFSNSIDLAASTDRVPRGLAERSM